MLERVQAERRDGGGVGMAVDAEHAAFLAQAVGVEVQIEIKRETVFEILGALIILSLHRPAPVAGRRNHLVTAAFESKAAAFPRGRSGRSRSFPPDPGPGRKRRYPDRWSDGASGAPARRPSAVLQPLQDGGFEVLRQQRHQPLAGPLQHDPRLGVADRLRLRLLRHQPVEEHEGDDHDDQAARQPEQEAEACGRARRCGCRGSCRRGAR